MSLAPDPATTREHGRRRMTRAVTFLLRVAPATIAWASVAAFILLSIGAPLLGHGVFLGTDALVRYHPWLDGGTATNELQNSWIGDTIDFYAPQTMVLADSVRDGDYAWWNPYIIGGTPLGSLPDTGLFSPLTWVWLIVPATYAPGAMKLVEMVVAVIGMALLTRRWGASSAAQAVSGLIYISGGFMIAWTNWPHTRVAALVPLLFWATDRILCNRRWRDLVPMALVLASMLLTGFPAVLGMAVYGVLAYAVVRLLVLKVDWRAWIRSAVLGISGAALGALLSAWQLAPWAVHAMTTVDFAEREQLPTKHLGWYSLSATVAPGMMGDIGDAAKSNWIAGANPIEAVNYVGVGAVVLILVLLVLRGRTRLDRAMGWFAVGGIVTCIALIYQGGTILALAQELPIFSNNSVTRLRFLMTFFIAIGAAIGLDRLLRLAWSRFDAKAGTTPVREEPARRWVPAWIGYVLRWAAALGIVAWLVWNVDRSLDLIPSKYRDLQIDGAQTAALAAVVVIVLALVAALVRWRVLGVAVAAALSVLLAGQALSTTRAWWPVSDEDTFYPETATHEFLQENLGTDRYLGVDWTMFTGSNNPYHIRSVTGHGFHTTEWKSMLREINPDAMRTKTYSQLDWDAVGSPVLDRMGVRYAVESPDVQPPGDVEIAGAVAEELVFDGGARSAPVTGPIRAVQVALPQGVEAGEDGRVVVRVLDENDEVLAESERVTPDVASAFWVAVPGEDIPADQQVRLEVRIEGATQVILRADAEGNWATELIRPADDDLTVVHGGDAVIYQRENAASRIRWADDNVVIDDEDERLAAIGSGEIPTDTVILEDAADEAELTGTSEADLQVLEDGQRIRVQVDADGAGWLVIAESVRGAGGWSATLDGESTALVDADEAMGAVYVPEGTHEIELSYRPPGLTVGIAGSITAVLLLLALIIVPPVLDRRRRRSGTATVTPSPEPTPEPTADQTEGDQAATPLSAEDGSTTTSDTTGSRTEQT